jgi:hypothetical protein
MGVGLNPDITVVGDNVYIVGEGQGENTFAIFFRMSIDNGDTFGKIENVTTAQSQPVLPAVAAVTN